MAEQAVDGRAALVLPPKPVFEYREKGVTRGALHSDSSSGNEDSDGPAECDNDRMWIFAQRLLPQKRQRAQPSVACPIRGVL